MSDGLIRLASEPYLSRQPITPAQLVRVGYFDDGLTVAEHQAVLNDMRWITPTEHLAPEGIVLCTTGAFDPLHVGHIDMLVEAKYQLESRGLKVAGALIQPDHDVYVSAKHPDAHCTADRIQWAQDYTREMPWIAVDPWPSTYQDRQLNYTMILRRTERYLNRLGKYQVVYVFGSDNAGFADAFLPHEYVCIQRTAASSTESRKTVIWPLWDRPSYMGGDYLIRDDLAWATERWSAPDMRLHLRAFMIRLKASFMGVWPHYVPKELDVAKQQRIVDEQLIPPVNFDAVTGGTHWVTRLFHPCAAQYHPVDWRTSMLELIPAGEHVLFDDDIASGTTLNYIKSQTPQIKWLHHVSLAQAVHPGPIFDIVDARDFLFGSRLGGLGIKWQGSSYRAPYINPWVDLTSRAKIPPAKQAAFTKAVIQANMRFFEACPTIVAETGNSEFWVMQGWRMDTPMLKVAQDLLAWNPNI